MTYLLCAILACAAISATADGISLYRFVRGIINQRRMIAILEKQAGQFHDALAKASDEARRAAEKAKEN